jgi:uncharacterized membrane protein YfcA
VDYLLICVVAILASGVTLFSGFGLGSVLMAAFAVFFPVPIAVAATAVVHFANNLFKAALVGRHADWRVVLRFGVPAACAAFAGAALLAALADLPAIAEYRLGARSYTIRGINLMVGCLIVLFALLELTPRFAKLAFPRRYLFVGGLLSGFFGGLSGNQGAFRSAFLIKAGLGKEAFVGTGVIASAMVDLVRLAVYGASLRGGGFGGIPENFWSLVAAACLAAFAGATIGARLLPHVTLHTVRLVVAFMMIAIGFALIFGFV